MKAKMKNEILRQKVAEIINDHAVGATDIIMVKCPTEEAKDRYQFKLNEAVTKIMNLMNEENRG